MRPSTSILSLALPLLAFAAPAARRANAVDVLVLQFAGVLEALETEFYAQALSKFQASDFTVAGFSDPNVPIQQFLAIGQDEATHLTFLEETLKSLGSQAVPNCQFDFSSALTDVATMAPIARTVELVGVGAYLGAANLISDPAILTAAATILTVEARHQTILNLVNDATSIPQAFDIALTPNEVLAIAGSFISGCSTGIASNAALSITNTGAIVPGTKLAFASPAMNGNKANIASRSYKSSYSPSSSAASAMSSDASSKSSKSSSMGMSSSSSGMSSKNSNANGRCSASSQLFCQIIVGGATTSLSLALEACAIPDGLNGPAVVFITCDENTIPNDVVSRAANSGSILAGPTIIFIDVEVDILAGLSKTGAACEGSGSISIGSSSSSSNSYTSSSSVASSSMAETTTAASSTSAAEMTSAAATTTAMAASSAAATSTAMAASSAAAMSTAMAAGTTAGGASADVTTATINSSMAASIISEASADASGTPAATSSAVANVMYGSVPARR